jgi:ABC-type microcin C transport system permease subunit YejE
MLVIKPTRISMKGYNKYMNTVTHITPSYPKTVWPRWLYDLLLAILFLGPIISPLFQASSLPLVADTGWLARDVLSRFVCPTPERSYVLLGFPMGVCARCWGATIGLLLARFAWNSPLLAQFVVRFAALPLLTRLLLCALPFLFWPLEIIGHYQGWWYAPMGLLLLNGAQAGFAAGLFFCSIWLAAKSEK